MRLMIRGRACTGCRASEKGGGVREGEVGMGEGGGEVGKLKSVRICRNRSSTPGSKNICVAPTVFFNGGPYLLYKKQAV